MTQHVSIHHLSADAVTDQCLHAFLIGQPNQLASAFFPSKYMMLYVMIITRALSRWDKKPTDVYTEKHHIIPKCMGGPNAKWNYAILTPREHFICHRLLERALKDPYHQKLMKHACFYMLHHRPNPDSILSSRKYDAARKLYHTWLTEIIARNPDRREAIRQSKLLYWADPANRAAQSERIKAVDAAKSDAYRLAEQKWLTKASHDFWTTITPDEKKRIYDSRKKTAHNRGLLSYFDPNDYSKVGLYPKSEQPIGWVRGDPSLWKNGSPSKKTLQRWSKQ